MLCSDFLLGNCQTSKVRKHNFLSIVPLVRKKVWVVKNTIPLVVQNENSLLAESADLKNFACLLLILQADAHDLLM